MGYLWHLYELSMALFAHGSLIPFIREAKIILRVIDEGVVCGKWIHGMDAV